MTVKPPPQTPAVIIRLIETPGLVLALAAHKGRHCALRWIIPLAPPSRWCVPQVRTLHGSYTYALPTPITSPPPNPGEPQ